MLASSQRSPKRNKRFNPTSISSLQNNAVQRLFPLFALIALPLILSRRLWQEIWSGVLSRGWDGTGHYAIAQIYNSSIFPDTFGWTNSYFGGMPFPNFYPPLFYWLVALLQHTHLFSFATAFKLVV